jgi:hypothetical protein
VTVGVTVYDIDIDTLEEYAASGLERPSDAAFWDDRLYTTHAPVIGWAERGDDILEESNYLSALSLIEGAAGDDKDEHVIDATVGHWLVGSLRQLFVQVRDADGEFTAAFREAVELSEGLKDYPVVDESDYSEREWKAWEENASEAIDQAQRDYPDDTDEESQEIRDRVQSSEELGETYGYESNGGVDWDKVADIYREHRDEFFLAKATEVYRWNVLGYSPDQLALPLAV